jgi:beta-1,2 N-acetylglucosaminyltransferase
MKKIMLAMATYNRKEVLERTIVSLTQVKNIEDVDIFIFDDCSTEYTKEDLKKMIPFAKQIVVRENNLRADRNMYQIHQDYINSNYDILLQVDSDVIFHKNFIEIIKSILSTQTKYPVFSLYNSSNHPFVENRNPLEINKIIFKEKHSIGGICVLFTDKNILKNILDNIPKERKSFAYDWYWSHKLQEKGTPVMVSEQSFLQHIGVEGQNNKEIKGIDIGLYFTPTNTNDLEFLLHHYEIVISNFAKQNDKYVFFSRNNFFIKCVITIYRFIKSFKRKIFNK